mmetsp:Transcript_39791/g.113480  ORF Transcript_39791/g.113480 Transcript_39791/m.113480 type:complete len:124 (-) Transcript_39791:479-850(-)
MGGGEAGEGTHPEIEPSKSYDLRLAVGQKKNQKLTYTNMTGEDQVYHLRTSHPAFMVLKEDKVPIAAAATGKFAILFKEVSEACEKSYYLYVDDSDNNLIECIQINIIYIAHGLNPSPTSLRD